MIGAVAGRLQREGCGANVLGDPRLALTWRSNELSGHGITLAAAQVVTTGTCLMPLPVGAGECGLGRFWRAGPRGAAVYEVML